MSILDPRMWLAFALALAAAFGSGYWKGNTHGKRTIQAEWTASVAAANEEARRLERARQSAADAAGRLAAAREDRIRADADRAAGAVRGLRDALSTANRRREESAAAAAERAAALGELLAQGAEAHRELAQRCDRHVNDIQMLLEAWPK